MKKCFLGRCMVAFLMMPLICLPVFAAGCLLTVDVGAYSPMLEGARLSLYLVGNDASDGIRMVGDFADSSVVLNEENMAYGADLLAEYVRQHGLEGTDRQLGSSGSVVYPKVLPGIYLLMQREKTPDDVTVIPFLIRIPEDQSAVTAYPKVTVPNVTPPESELPQTGTYRWLVPLIGAAGILFLALGLLVRHWQDGLLEDK